MLSFERDIGEGRHKGMPHRFARRQANLVLTESTSVSDYTEKVVGFVCNFSFLLAKGAKQLAGCNFKIMLSSCPVPQPVL